MSNWTDDTWREAMKLRIDITNVSADVVGPEDGVADAEVEALLPKLEEIQKEIAGRKADGTLPFLSLPQQDTTGFKDYIAGLPEEIDTFVVVGIGGSALGNIACQTALRHPYHNALPVGKRNGLKLEVPDNVDPDRLAGLLETVDPQKTLFNVITKSGSTAETASTFLLVKAFLQKALGDEWKQHIVLTTDPEKGDLRTLAQRMGITAFDIPAGVGGRFSVLTPVGLLSGCATGIDIDELLAGAAAMEERIRETPLSENPAYVSAAVHYLMYNKTARPKPLAVMMPYSHALKDVADWFRQLWAESLGKEHDLDGNVVNVGPTPVKALGVTDQHSQVQLYAEGPNDKLFTFLGVERFHTDLPFSEDSDTADLNAFNYFPGKSMGQLMHAEQLATKLALTRKNRPNLTITLPEVRPYTVGQLFMLLEIQTVVAGGLMNIDPFDQPGVEAGKVATYALMDRPGYTEERERIDAEVAAATQRVL